MLAWWKKVFRAIQSSARFRLRVNRELALTRLDTELRLPLPECERVVPKLLRALRPGGALAVEDINFEGYVSHPANSAHDRYVALYREVVRRRGGNADIGPKLLAMFARAGLQDFGLNIVYPEHKEGSGKEISVLTMIGISEAVLAEKLIEEQELRDVVAELDRYTRDPLSIVCGPRVFQVWGRRAFA